MATHQKSFEDNMRTDTSWDANHANACKRIGVVDNEPLVTRFLTKILALHGFAVMANDVVQTLGRLRGEPNCVDLLLTDQSMLDMTGTELVAEACALRSTLPVVLITGYSETTTCEDVQAWGLSGYMTKLIDTGELLTEVQRALTESANVALH
jgi:DNA-binding NtrC family response regulator